MGGVLKKYMIYGNMREVVYSLSLSFFFNWEVVSISKENNILRFVNFGGYI